MQLKNLCLLALLLAGVAASAQTTPSPLRLPAKGPPRPAWLGPTKPSQWLDWSADSWRIPDLDANPLLLGVARFRAAPAKVLPRLERTLGPRGGSEPHNPIFIFERGGARLLARVVPVMDADTGKEYTDLKVVAYPEVPKDCTIAAPPGARSLEDNWRFADENEFSRPSTIAAFAGGGDDRRLRGYFKRTLEAPRPVVHGSRQWIAGRACGTWVLVTFHDKTPWTEKAWVTRVLPAPAWIVVKLEQRDE